VPRKQVPSEVEIQVLTLSRRRCCLCFWIDGNEDRVKGQIAHLDQNAEHSDVDNLVFLCLNHHDEYDGRTSVSKGLKELEVRHYRDRLYKEMDWDENPPSGRAQGSDERPGDRAAIGAQGEEQDHPRFLDYLDGLSGDELFMLAKAVLISKSQTIYRGRVDPIADALTHKHFLEAVQPVHPPDPKSKLVYPTSVIPTLVWRYLNDQRDWLRKRVIATNLGRQDRIDELRASGLYPI
jgi:hypothetical protein